MSKIREVYKKTKNSVHITNENLVGYHNTLLSAVIEEVEGEKDFVNAGSIDGGISTSAYVANEKEKLFANKKLDKIITKLKEGKI